MTTYYLQFKTDSRMVNQKQVSRQRGEDFRDFMVSGPNALSFWNVPHSKWNWARCL